jgi:hypothetical protein
VPKARFFFFGTDADGETINYQVIGWHAYPVSTATTWYLPTTMAQGTATLSTLTVDTSIIAASGLFADIITDVVGTATAGNVIVGSAVANAIHFLEVNLHGACCVTCETDIGTAKAAYVFIQLGS